MIQSTGPGPKQNLLILASSLWIGGAETVMRHLAESIDRQHFNVTVCHLKGRGQIGDELARAGIDIVGIADSDHPHVDYFTFTKVLKVIRDRQIDVVHTHTAHGLVDAALCKWLTPGLKVVHTFHFGNYPHTRTRILWMERVCSRFADRLCAVGEVQRQQLKRVHWLRDDAVGVVWNGVVPGARGSASSFRDDFGLRGHFVIGTIATLIEQKGLRDYMRVARKVRDAGHEVKFVIVGEGPLRGELEALRQSLGLEDTVVLTGWVTNAADVALPEFDVFYQPSLWEAMSVVILEAMAAAKPIVATRAGENPYIIEHGTDGLLADVGDLDGMARALIDLITQPRLRAHLRANAGRKVERQFTVDHMTRAYEQIYREVLSAPSRTMLQRDSPNGAPR